MIKVDLHTHSTLSKDGGISATGYERFLKKQLDQVAITDHDQIDFALELNRSLGDKVIVGSEISTSEGHLIGLFLQEKIKAGMSVAKTSEAIREQGGIVYLPHPNDLYRHGIDMNSYDESMFDIVEKFNARSFNHPTIYYKIPKAVGSDAHSRFEVGRTFNKVSSLLTAENIIGELDKATYSYQQVNVLYRLAPSYHRTRKFLTKSLS